MDLPPRWPRHDGAVSESGTARPTLGRIAGQSGALLGWILWIVLQVAAGDPFPPEISLSQYGLGGTGWLFSVWVLVVAITPLLLLRSRPVPGAARWLLLAGLAGTAVMAFVRTDEGGPQLSMNAKVHQAGSVMALIFVPLGILLVLRYAPRRHWRVGLLLVVAGAVAGGLVLVSASGLDTAGLGPARSWALWQGILIIIEMLLVSLYALVVGTIDPGSGPARGPSPVQSALR